MFTFYCLLLIPVTGERLSKWNETYSRDNTFYVFTYPPLIPFKKQVCLRHSTLSLKNRQVCFKNVVKVVKKNKVTVKMENIELRQKTEESTDVEKPKYPWHLFIRTVVLLNAFLGACYDDECTLENHTHEP